MPSPDVWLDQRRLPVGAEVLDEGVHFRVWAPQRKRVEVVFEGSPAAFELSAEVGGYFSGFTRGRGDGALYWYRLDGEPRLYPDPASRFQPRGVHGPSEVIDPSQFPWSDRAWKGVAIAGQVIYEMHVGTFTPEGTYESASRQFDELAGLGITVLEIMPVSEFPGRFGWGYDGVDIYTPTRLYGRPDDLRRFVDRAHAAGLAVILDVVYNHVGPDGNYLPRFTGDYFTDRYENEWGDAINYDGENAGPVREFFVGNAGYWIDEFHMDGLRLDATQSIHDQSHDHVIAAIVRRVRRAAGGRETIVVAENEPQNARLVQAQDRGGYGIDALWNDDFHHSAMAAVTGHNEAYYTDHPGLPQEFISAAKHGYLYQGQLYSWQGKRRGTPCLNCKPAAFVIFVQNHDQIANSLRGLRIHLLTSPGRYRAVTALMLLAPGTPMLFQGQEFASSSPFFYFADHKGELAGQVREGRTDFLSQFRSARTPGIGRYIADPGDPDTFRRCRLNFAERESNAAVYALHRDLLRLRREHAAFRIERAGGVDGAVLGPEAFLLRFFGPRNDDRLLLVNFGIDLHLSVAPEPLLAPPEGMRWGVLWSSEAPEYGGAGTPTPEGRWNWRIPGHAALVMSPHEATPGELEMEKQTELEVERQRKREKREDA